MRNLFIIIILSFYSSSAFLYANESYESFLEEEIEDLSFYMGYLIGRDHAKNSYGFPTKFEKIIQGMQAGMAGEPVCKKEELVPLIKRMQKTVVEKQTALNLQEAETYLKLVAGKENVFVAEPSKLYYIVEKDSNGPTISNHPYLHFKMSELKEGEIRLIYSTYEDKGESLQVDLEAIVPGFRKGIQGMKVDEIRTIYSHPDLAFGMGKLDIAPNRLIIFEVLACKG